MPSSLLVQQKNRELKHNAAILANQLENVRSRRGMESENRSERRERRRKNRVSRAVRLFSNARHSPMTRARGSVRAWLQYDIDQDMKAGARCQGCTSDDGGGPAAGNVTAPVEVDVLNGRLGNNTDGDTPRLDVHSFQLVRHVTALSMDDFYNSPDRITDVYYKEMANLIKNHTGAARVLVFHHQVRCRDKLSKDGSVDDYVEGIHSDSSAVHAEGASHPLISQVASEEEGCSSSAIDFAKGRVLFINAWRSIDETHPVANHHLALCDATSLVKPDDYITACDFSEDILDVFHYRLGSRHSSKHRWYYYPRMTKDEVLLFKQWDSDLDLEGRLCFHTAFADPTAPTDAPPRQSIECRAMAIFPDDPGTIGRNPNQKEVSSPTAGESTEEHHEKGNASMETREKGSVGTLDHAGHWSRLFSAGWLVWPANHLAIHIKTSIKGLIVGLGRRTTRHQLRDNADNGRKYQLETTGDKRRNDDNKPNDIQEGDNKQKWNQAGNKETNDIHATIRRLTFEGLKALSWVGVGVMLSALVPQARHRRS